jgi:hypothetical protein
MRNITKDNLYPCVLNVLSFWGFQMPNGQIAFTIYDGKAFRLTFADSTGLNTAGKHFSSKDSDVEVVKLVLEDGGEAYLFESANELFGWLRKRLDSRKDFA